MAGGGIETSAGGRSPPRNRRLVRLARRASGATSRRTPSSRTPRAERGLPPLAGLDDLLAVAAETEPHVDALRDDYLANVGDAARQTADAIAALATPPGPGGVGRARPV
jgi:hypothetical protein